MLFIEILFIFLILDVIPSDGLTQEELCTPDKNRRFTNFKVNAAFKVRDFIGLIGQLWGESETESEATSATIRVFHMKKQNPSSENELFFEAKVWNEIQNIDNEWKINYAFNTDNMPTIFKDQTMSELVYIVQDTNTTTAIQFNYPDLEAGNDTTFNPKTDTKRVYDISHGIDETDYLNLKFLLTYFPDPGLKIIGIMIFDRNRDDFEYKSHYAIVYTIEMFRGQPWYFRHYMKSTRNLYKDVRSEEQQPFYRLDWSFDGNINFCSRLYSRPTSVVLLREEVTIISKNSFQLKLHFVEFYGLTHKLMDISFMGQKDEYNVEMDNTRLTGGQGMSNAEAFLYCQPHPISINPEPIPCDEDYIDERNQIVNNIYGKGSEFRSRSSQKSISNFDSITITLLSMALLLVMAVGLYFGLKSDKNS